MQQDARHDATPTQGQDGGPDEGPGVVVYWRRGCPFCMALRFGLRRAGLGTSERDIWADADDAAFVRAHAGGNETVPTVDVAGTVLVNPSTKAVLAAARDAGLDVPARRGRLHRR